MTWAIYGATGHTGRMIAREAIARREAPLLLARNPVLLRALGDELDLPTRVTGSAAAITAAALDVDLIVNAAGSFALTTPAVLHACIVGGAHYLDIANELDSVTSVFAHDAAVTQAGIAALPAVGFGTVATDAAALAALAALGPLEEVAAGASVEVAMFAQNAPGGPGTGASVVSVLAQGGVRLVDSVVQRSRLGAGAHAVETPLGRRGLVPIATGDLATVPRSTGVTTVTASAGFRAPVGVLRLGLPVASALARTTLLNSLPESSSSGQHNSAAWARATDSAGRTATAWLTTGEGYAFTASSVLNAVHATLADAPLGATTVAAAFGPDFALRVPGTGIRLLH